MGILEGKVAFITGGGSGIGAATAATLASEGARVACTDIDLAAAERTAKEIESAGGTALALALDVSDEAANVAVVERVVDEWGALHIAHLNAGTGGSQPVLEHTAELWDRTIAVNLTGVFFGIKAAGAAIIESGGGSIVITSSAAGLRGVAGSVAYSASKHGVIGLAKSAAVELASQNVRVNAICPAIVDTPLIRNAFGDDAIAGLGMLQPLGRVGQPEEVARLVRYLVSDDAVFITGSVYPIDGGLTAG
ncbi:MAG TPA: SDR family NAD(P)-dependent oxidoreductase [Acidimicrobiales bacterium]|nr:SDR family NAD(P)-dependent oxidoreductase [Acidimicrobiales bacterium]